MTVEPKCEQRREDALRIFMLEREALERSRFDDEAHQLGDTARKLESAPRLVNPYDVKVRPQRNHLFDELLDRVGFVSSLIGAF